MFSKMSAGPLRHPPQQAPSVACPICPRTVPVPVGSRKRRLGTKARRTFAAKTSGGAPSHGAEDWGLPHGLDVRGRPLVAAGVAFEAPVQCLLLSADAGGSSRSLPRIRGGDQREGPVPRGLQPEAYTAAWSAGPAFSGSRGNLWGPRATLAVRHRGLNLIPARSECAGDTEAVEASLDQQRGARLPETPLVWSTLAVELRSA
ncbi:hypothetical protein NDU88_001254 [Pleurodeles waltl]|uniref:Uncharacterized protein n=1 Tax=Pleurodeles waltl TaxID=8319 RepID=A0AAV7VBC7_PLEWA|nr:hypothetical protein NDU88_001254 [Pleurodeles waltl]